MEEKAAVVAIASLLRLVDDSEKTGVRCGSDRVVVVLNSIASAFETRQDAGKFAACGGLAALLDLIKGSFELESATMTAVSKAGAWQQSVAAGLREVLGSKLGEGERDDALRLAAVTTEFSRSVEWTGSADKLLPLLIRTASVELRMALEDRTIAQATALTSRVVTCCIVCERAIKLLADNGPMVRKLALEPQALVGVHGALAEAAAAALSVVEAADGGDDVAMTGAMDDTTRLLQLSCVRLVGAWAAEETEAINERVNECLPALLQLVTRLDAEDEASGTALRWLLPGFCHITAEDAGRARFVEGGGHTATIRILLDHWLPFAAVQQEDLGLSSITACSALLNIAVLAPLMVTSEPVFRELRDRLVQLVGSVDFGANPLLFANLVTLLLRVLLHIPFLPEETQPDWGPFCAALAPLAEAGRGKTSATSSGDDLEDVVALWGLAEQALGATSLHHPLLLQSCKRNKLMP
jgi:hypothetical protein